LKFDRRKILDYYEISLNLVADFNFETELLVLGKGANIIIEINNDYRLLEQFECSRLVKLLQKDSKRLTVTKLVILAD
jgi:hypothetical protein